MFAFISPLRGLQRGGKSFLQRCDSYAACVPPRFQPKHQNIQHELVK